MRTAHIITRLIIGGAQENTLFNVDDQHHLFGDEVCLITGPGLGPEGTLERQARDRGLDVKILPELCRSLNPLQDWKALGSIRRVLRDYAPDIVHTHSSKAGILGRLAAWQLGLPAVHTIHGAAFHYGQHPVLHQAYRLAERLAANWCDHFITVCDAMTQQYVAAGVASAERFTTVYSGMDVDRFLAHSRPPADVRRELNLSETDVVFGKVGRLFHLKGHNYLIEAAPAVVAEIPNARFILVGDGVLREQYERRIQELGLSSHFRLVGLVAPDAVSDYIHAMDVVVHTSDWEGLPRVVAQGLIAGKPVVTFRLDGAPEVCVDGVTGFLVEHRNVPQLSAAMIRLGTQPDLCRQFGDEGQRRFSGQFRHEFMTSRIREIYRQVLDRRAVRGR
ncbi:MAG: putative glycosyltransferase EpsD [Planctomycetota bacterium]|jgi:glycosyltransferase involved in cell wall biosynthesis